MSRALKPFDVVTAPYVSLDGKVKTYPDGGIQKGLFMVIAVDYDNVVCCKITSQRREEYLSHSFTLDRGLNGFLRVESFVQLDKLHTLDVDVAEYIGSVDKSSRYDIYQVFCGFFVLLADNLRRFAPPPKPGYRSPNSK